MELYEQKCRLCLSETEFSITLNSSFCRKSNLIDKILVTLRLPIEENETSNRICFKCAGKVESYYEFVTEIKNAQTKLSNSQMMDEKRRNVKQENDYKKMHLNKRLVTKSYLREQVFDADYTFSFLETSKEEEKLKVSSPFFSYFSPQKEPSNSEKCLWKSSQVKSRLENDRRSLKCPEKVQKMDMSRHLSRDLFESQSQDHDRRPYEWKLTPEDNIMNRVREKCFGLTDL